LPACWRNVGKFDISLPEGAISSGKCLSNKVVSELAQFLLYSLKIKIPLFDRLFEIKRQRKEIKILINTNK